MKQCLGHSDLNWLLNKISGDSLKSCWKRRSTFGQNAQNSFSLGGLFTTYRSGHTNRTPPASKPLEIKRAKWTILPIQYSDEKVLSSLVVFTWCWANIRLLLFQFFAPINFQNWNHNLWIWISLTPESTQRACFERVIGPKCNENKCYVLNISMVTQQQWKRNLGDIKVLSVRLQAPEREKKLSTESDNCAFQVWHVWLHFNMGKEETPLFGYFLQLKKELIIFSQVRIFISNSFFQWRLNTSINITENHYYIQLLCSNI